jgi:hypothetical protein
LLFIKRFDDQHTLDHYRTASSVRT